MESADNVNRCLSILAAAGGWDGVSASDASEMAEHCPGVVRDAISRGFLDASRGESFEPVSEEIPAWTGGVSNMDFSDMTTIGDNPMAWIAPLGGVPLLGAPQGGGIIGEIIKGAAGAVAGEVAGQLMQTPQYQVGVTPGAACWGTGKINRRMRVKLQRLPDGTVQVVRYCAPRRMNPLNPRALRRAASRLGSFHKIASNIEKMVQRACRTGRKAAPRRIPGCAPKRCR